MATADALVTVKQHGFFIPKDQRPYRPPRRAADAPPSPDAPELRRDEGLAGLLSRQSGSAAALAPPSPPTVDFPGEVTVGEHAHLTPGAKALVRAVARGLKAWQAPQLEKQGMGGSYTFRNDRGAPIALMKPCDEEPLAPNNPKGFVGRQLGEPGLKPTVRVGEAATREAAAYLLDHGHFARVPHTVLVEMRHPVFHVADGAAPLPFKRGSLQEYVPHDCDSSDVGASRFPVRDIHRIGILDVRLFNTDRHAGNILVRRLPPAARADSGAMPTSAAALLEQPAYELIPIDHGFALPESLEPPYFEWQHWPQAMMPFGRKELEYIASLDARADVELLRRELPSLRPDCLRLLEVTTTLLQKAAAAGLSLAEVAAVATRPIIGMEEEASELERICFAARAEVEDAREEAEMDDEVCEECEEEDGVDSAADLPPPGAGMLRTQCHVDGVQSPTCSVGGSSSSGVATTVCPMSISTSDPRLDDSLFCMDEDGARTPGARSPDRAATAGLAGPTRFASEAVAARLMRPATPAAGGRCAFASPQLDAVCKPASGVGYLAVSMDSLALGGGSSRLTSEQSSPEAAGADGVDMSSFRSAATAFGGVATYAPRQLAHGLSAALDGAKSLPRPAGKTRRRRPRGAASRKRGPAAPGGELFAGLSADEWEHFMHSVRCQMAAALRSGAWKAVKASAGKGAPMMSCPRF